MLVVQDLTFRIAGRTLLEEASVVIPTGAKAGFVGRNGTGKTTLFKLVTGEWAAESGSISFPKAAKIGQVAQEAPGSAISLLDFVLAADKERASLLAEAETATDPTRIGEIHTRLADIGAHSAEARAATILSGLGFSHEAQARPCSDFSGGWRMRVALAAVLFSEPDLLLLDEPTNYLDLEGTLWLEDYVRRYPHTVVVISHDRDLLNAAVDMIVHLDHGKLVAYRGGYDGFERQRREKMILTQKMKEKVDAQRAHMQAFIDRFKAKATKARQAQSRMKALAKLQPIAAMTDDAALPLSFPQPIAKLSPPILALDDVSVGYDPAKPILRKITMRIDVEDRIALLGSNGNGKSTFAKLIAEKLAPFSGRVARANKLSIAYFAQHQLDELRPAESPFQHVQRLVPDQPEARTRSRVAQMGLPTSRMDTPARDLSGGEKARLLLGLATFAGPNLMILDEPTNHLDIDSREALVQAINEYEGAVILISHDRHLVEATADRLMVVGEGTVKEFDGDLEDYRRLVLEGASGAKGGDKGNTDDGRLSALDRRRAAAALREQLAPLRKRIKDAESRIEKLQKEIARLDGDLADPDLFTRDAAKGTRLMKTRSDAERALAETEDLWLTLSAEHEEAERAALDG
ncbi:ABC-F family ATP-binding cassette domain-containing protein [Pinisolibacter aquiterrae]|uniref:ABC-F family ATP-binding cassette domain-containing protein n=1 Tax=Pinisolibacter aquiterrae TaxID=2815579 RepID=UPI001C3D19C7|nr:ABC-F family ATP-binding cassette domain-containing protein [Pinisolibacter aquiterrae]MBV5264185.1 ABC-F family ATP-binding cassette domain-containing protein [Pinisolibacter aquiterrae]MCC8233721.1 ABC-F family ATP-binding cassette domain-containing protein [Pinisolibacter aquiterrae]